MPKILKAIIFGFFLLFTVPTQSLAITDPLAVSNNIFGIHITNLSDLNDAAKLVNSQGGDWGYITLVITPKDRSIALWQKVFDEMRRLHLIPIVRIATNFDGVNWSKGDVEDIDNWVFFLNSLNWVSQNRYVIIGNEVNLGKEWGGAANPEEYAKYLKEFSQKLKSENPDFFVMAAGLDASLPSSRFNLSETTFLKRMFKDKTLFNYLDGLASHSYPNPNFSASASAFGRGSLRTFEWELDYLKILGLTKKWPVFITETGWIHKVKNDPSTENLLSEKEVINRYNYAFNYIWNHPQIAAVTPFILNYEQPPFDKFSLKENGTYGEIYNGLLKIPKNSGKPLRINKGILAKFYFPGIVALKNSGQVIWEKDKLGIKGEGSPLKIKFFSKSLIEPGETLIIVYESSFSSHQTEKEKTICATYNGKEISNCLKISHSFF